jgi:hypothetical protein
MVLTSVVKTKRMKLSFIDPESELSIFFAIESFNLKSPGSAGSNFC